MASRKDSKNTERCDHCFNQIVTCSPPPSRFEISRDGVDVFKAIMEHRRILSSSLEWDHTCISREENSQWALQICKYLHRCSLPAEVKKCHDANDESKQRFYEELDALLYQNWYRGAERVEKGLRCIANYYRTRLGDQRHAIDKHHTADKLICVLGELLEFNCRFTFAEFTESEEIRTIREIEKIVPFTSNTLTSDALCYSVFAVHFADKYMFKSAEDMLMCSKMALSHAVVPVAYRLKFCFASWFYTKQLLKVTGNETNRRRLKESMRTAQLALLECLFDETQSCEHERLSLLQRMLFTVLGIETYGCNLSNYEISDEDISVAETLLKKSVEMKDSFNPWHALHFYLAQAKFLLVTGNPSKSTEYLEAAEALVTNTDFKAKNEMMRDCLERFKETLHADKCQAEQPEKDFAGTRVPQNEGVFGFFKEYINPSTDVDDRTRLHVPKCVTEANLHAIEQALRRTDRQNAHERLLEVAKYIRQSDTSDIYDVWPAYEEHNPWEPIFVVLTYSNIQGEWETLFGFRVFKRRYDFVSSEAAVVINCKEVKENPLDYSDFDKLKTVTQSESLTKDHSKITIINACSHRSKKGGEVIYKETCVVIHCLVKGFIPFLEDPFPKSISGVPVDVREGYVTMGMNRQASGGQCTRMDRTPPGLAVRQEGDWVIVDNVHRHHHLDSVCEKFGELDLADPSVQIGSRCTDINRQLLMGTTISRTGLNPMTGTLGGFVSLPGIEMGFLTCAHVVGTNKFQTVSQPSHADLPPSHRSSRTICGHVEQAVFDPGRCDETGVDAAVVRISKRKPNDGQFIWVSPESLSAAGFPSSLKFSSGKVLTRDELRENRRTDVIKVGSQSGLTRGSLYLTETFVRISNRDMILPGGEKVEFYNQMEIQSHAGSKAFFELGDSGSLVFMPLKDNELHCIGLAIGKTSYSSCLVTPISAVLERLGLKDKLMQLGVLNAQPRNGFHLRNGRL